MANTMKPVFSNVSIDEVRRQVDEKERQRKEAEARRQAQRAEQLKTPAGAVAEIYKISQTDRASADKFMAQFEAERQDKSSVYYNPYTAPTNTMALQSLAELGVEVNQVDDAFIQNYSWLKNYQRSGISGTPLAPTKSSSREEAASYYYNKVLDAEDTTRKAETEWQSLQKELAYWAARSDRNYSDDELLAKVDMSKYPTLRKLDEEKAKGTPVQLNRGIGYSQDALEGVIWAARGNESSGDAFTDAVNSRLGRGITYKPSARTKSRLDPQSKSYNPYVLGSTLDEEAAFFGMSGFDQKWLDENLPVIMSGQDEDAKKLAQRVYNAEQTTQKAEQQLSELTSISGLATYAAEDAIRLGISPEQALDDILDFYELSELSKLSEGLKRRQPIGLTRAVGFDYQSMVHQVQSEIDRKKMSIAEAAATETARVAEQDGDTTQPETVPQSSVDAPKDTLPWAVGAFKDVTTWLMGIGGHDTAVLEPPAETPAVAPATKPEAGKPASAIPGGRLIASAGMSDAPMGGEPKGADESALENADRDRLERYRQDNPVEPKDSEEERQKLQAELDRLNNLSEMSAADAQRAAEIERQLKTSDRGGYLDSNPALNVKRLQTTKGWTIDDIFTALNLGYVDLAGKDGAKKVTSEDLKSLKTVDLETARQFMMMTDKEVAEFTSRWNESEEKAWAYFKDLQRTHLNADLRAYQDEKSKKNAEISPVGAVIMNVFGGMGRTADALKITYGYLTGDPVVKDDPRLSFTAADERMKETLTAGYTDLGKKAYNLGMSVADQALRVLTSAAGGLGMLVSGTLAAGGAVASTAEDVTQRGGTADQAMGLGALSAGLEVLFNKLDIGRLFNVAKGAKLAGGSQGLMGYVKGLMSGFTKGFFPEMVEEGSQFVIEAAADIATMGAKSAWVQRFNYLKDVEMLSPDEAWTQTAADFGASFGESAVSGGLVGGLFGGAASIGGTYNGIMNHQAATQTSAKIDTETDPSAKQALTLQLTAQAMNARGETAKFAQQAMDNFGIDPTAIQQIGQLTLGKTAKGASFFDVLRAMGEKKTNPARVFEGALKAGADPVALAKVHLVANSILQGEDTASPIITDALKRAAGLNVDLDFTFKRWGEMGLLYVNNLVRMGAPDVAAALQTMPTFSQAAIVAEQQMGHINPTQEEVNKQIAAYAMDTLAPEVSENAAERAVNQAIESRTNALLNQDPVSEEEDLQSIQTAARHVAVTQADAAQAQQALDAANQQAYEMTYALDGKENDPNFAQLTKQAEAAVEATTKAEQERTRARESARAAQEAYDKLVAARETRLTETKRAAEETARVEIEQRMAERAAARQQAEAEAQAAALRRDQWIYGGVIPDGSPVRPGAARETATAIAGKDVAPAAPVEVAPVEVAPAAPVETAPAAPAAPVEEAPVAPARPETQAEIEAAADAYVQNKFSDSSAEDQEEAKRRFIAKMNDKLGRTVDKSGVFAQKSQAFVQRVEKKFGIKLVPDPGMKPGEEAYFDPRDNTIHLSAKASRSEALNGIIMHELTHAAQTSQWYDGYKKTVLRMKYGDDYANSDELRQDIQAKLDRYAAAGRTLASHEAAIEELVAQESRKTIFADEKAVNRLVEMDVSLGQRMLEALNRIIATIKGSFTGESAASLYKARDLLEKALTDNRTRAAAAETAETAETSDTTAGEYSAADAQQTAPEQVQAAPAQPETVPEQVQEVPSIDAQAAPEQAEAAANEPAVETASVDAPSIEPIAPPAEMPKPATKPAKVSPADKAAARTLKTQTAVAARVLKDAAAMAPKMRKDSPARSLLTTAIPLPDGKQMVSDGMRAMIFNKPLDLPTVAEGEDTTNLVGLIRDLIDKSTTGSELPLPTEQALKDLIAAHRARLALLRKNGNEIYESIKKPLWLFPDLDFAVRADWLIDMMQAFPDVIAFTPKDSVSPLGLKGNAGTGVILPVRFTGDTAKETAANVAERRDWNRQALIAFYRTKYGEDADPGMTDRDAEFAMTETRTSGRRYSLTDTEGADMDRGSDDAPLTAEQIEYFKDSKVRDAQGRLLKVYHGSPVSGITIFNTDSAQTKSTKFQMMLGTHLTGDVNYAEVYSRKAMNTKGTSRLTKNSGTVYEVYANLANPLDLSRDAGFELDGGRLWEVFHALPKQAQNKALRARPIGIADQHDNHAQPTGRKIIVPGVLEAGLEAMSPSDARAFLESQGYDGVIYDAEYTGNRPGQHKRDKSYIAFSPEQIKSTTNLTPTSSPDIRYSLTDTEGADMERDTQYLAAVESGDMDTAQKMVDEAAKAAGYTIKAYHGTPNYQVNKGFSSSIVDIHKLLRPDELELKPDAETFSDEYNRFWKFERWLKDNINKVDGIPNNLKHLFKKGVTEPFTVFDESRKGESTGAYDARRGFFFSENVAFADRFRSTYSYDRFTGIVKKESYGPGHLLTVYIKPGNMLDLRHERSADDSKGRQMRDDLTGYDTVFNKVKWNPDMNKNATRVTEEIMVTNPSNIKLADPVTYDDAGNPIPLSQRFTDSNDIRYSLTDTDDADMDAEIDRLIAKWGKLPQGEKAINTSPIPAQTGPELNVRRFARTASESGIFSPEEQAEFKAQLVGGRFSYEPISDIQASNNADDLMAQAGVNGLQQAWADALSSNKTPDKMNVAVGERLLIEYANSKDTDATMRMTAELAEVMTRAGQTVQAARLLKKMTPAGQLYYLQRAVNKLNRDNPNANVQLNPELVSNLMNSTDQQARDAAVEALSKDAGRQLPPSWKTRLNAWRYFAMLGNPRTHIRNIIGNAVFVPAVKIKNMLGAGLEAATGAARTKSALVTNSALLEAAKIDAKANLRLLMEGGKYNPADAIKSNAPSYGKSLPGRALQAATDFNSAVLEWEDSLFLQYHYAHALAGYMQANKLAFGATDETIMNAARQYAINEAKKATYRDASALASWLNEMSRKGGLTGLVIEGILPFKKTPVNILKRGIEYSPVGLLDSLTRGTRQLYRTKTELQQSLLNDRITQEQYDSAYAQAKSKRIDKLAAGMTGTMIAGLGAFLASLDLIKIGFKDDKADEFEKLTGHQEYAIEVFGQSITLDWMTPTSMPMFVGATLYEMYKQGLDPENAVKETYTALSRIMEPVFNLTMLEGVSSAIETASWSQQDPLSAVLMNSITNYAGQFMLTLGGQVARTIDPVRRRNYVDKGSPLPSEVQSALNKMLGKVPGVSANSEPYIDIWGQEEVTPSLWLRAFENMVSPAYINEITPDDVENALKEVHQQTGDPSVLPVAPAKSYTVNKQTINLTGAQYTQLSKVRGQTMRSVMENMIASEEFQGLETRLKAAALAKAIDYATQTGKASVIPEFSMTAWMKAATDPAQAILDKVIADDKDDQRSNYQAEALSAARTGDADSLEATYGALVEWYKAKDPKLSEKQLRSAIKSYLSDKVKAEYKAAYEQDDDDQMELIEDTLAQVRIIYPYSDWLRPER